MVVSVHVSNDLCTFEKTADYVLGVAAPIKKDPLESRGSGDGVRRAFYSLLCGQSAQQPCDSPVAFARLPAEAPPFVAAVLELPERMSVL